MRQLRTPTKATRAIMELTVDQLLQLVSASRQKRFLREVIWMRISRAAYETLMSVCWACAVECFFFCRHSIGLVIFQNLTETGWWATIESIHLDCIGKIRDALINKELEESIGLEPKRFSSACFIKNFERRRNESASKPLQRILIPAFEVPKSGTAFRHVEELINRR